jgi:hypothetical protein
VHPQPIFLLSIYGLGPLINFRKFRRSRGSCDKRD